jgi:hypothetical protein
MQTAIPLPQTLAAGYAHSYDVLVRGAGFHKRPTPFVFDKEFRK